MAPTGSNSLQQGNISTNEDGTGSFTFEAREEDDGTYTCQITGSTANPDSTTITVGNVFYTGLFTSRYGCIFHIVPTILMGPEDTILEYRVMLTATFTCTAFGGDNAELIFTWTTLDATEFDTNSRVEVDNADGSTTSTITTLPLSLSDRGKSYTCDVAYESDTSQEDEASATLNIGGCKLQEYCNIIIFLIL